MHKVEHKLEPRKVDSQTSAFYFLKLRCAPASLKELVKNEAPLAIPGDCFRSLTGFLRLSYEENRACLAEQWELDAMA